MATIVLFSSNMILSKIIQWIQGSPIGHCGVGIEMDGNQYIFHAAYGGVQITSREKVLSNHTIVAEYEVLVNFDDEIKIAKKRLGEPYDTIGLFGYIPVLIAKWFGIGIHNPFASKSAAVCSEFVVECDVNHEIPEFSGLDPENVKPKDLSEICEHGKSFKLLNIK